MPKRVKQRRKRQPKDINQSAYELVRRSTEGPEPPATTERDVISEYMSALGKKGGITSGKRRMKNYTPERRSEIAHKAALARWEKAKEKKQKH